MIKQILNLNGAQQLSKKEQNSIIGSGWGCWEELECESQCGYGKSCYRRLNTDCYECVPTGSGGQ